MSQNIKIIYAQILLQAAPEQSAVIRRVSEGLHRQQVLTLNEGKYVERE